MCFTKVFEIPFDLPKILSILLLLIFLLACIMVNPISLVILLASLVIMILILWIQHECECTQSSVDPFKLYFRLRRLSNMSWFSANQITIDCAPKSIQLIHPWSELLILWFGIIIHLHLSFELFRWFHNLLHLHSFLFCLSTETHIRTFVDYQVLCWIVTRQCPSHLNPLWVLPLIHDALVKLYPLLGQPCSAFGLVLFTSELCSICS